MRNLVVENLEVAGEEGMKFEHADKPTEGWLWRLVDAFVKEVRVYAKDQIEIVWSFSKPVVE